MEKSDLLGEIFDSYGLQGARAVFIRHNENMTYCVDEKYLLRIHKAKPGFKPAFFQGKADVARLHESELLFLEYLKENRIPVQTPVKNKKGGLVTVLQDGTAATMLTWLPGRTLESGDLTEARGYELGDLLGRLHMAAGKYQTGYCMRYDEALCRRLAEQLEGYYTGGMLDGAAFETMASALHVIGDSLTRTEPSHILVHSDLSCSNLLLTERGLTPIDFSLMGRSTPMLDFGSVFSFIGAENSQKNVIRGYRDVTGRDPDDGQIACCCALQILLSIALHYELWKEEDWFAHKLTQWCDEVFRPLLPS